MKKAMYLKDELLAETSIGEKMLSDWEKMKLVKADGVTSDRVPFYSKATLDRIDEGNFFFENQKCIVARAQPGGITVKISNIPIVDANIIDILKNFYRFHSFTSA